MTGKDLLIGLGDIGHKYYEEAEKDTVSTKQRPRGLRRPMLVAAMIGLALLLVGCAVVYALRLQDMSVGKETYTQYFDDTGLSITPTEKERDILTLYGHSGDPIQLALTEWYDFLETYDPDGALMDNIPDHAELPNQYEFTYGCYTPEMIHKVDEISAKYDLKLLEEWLPFQAWQSDIFYAETGIDSFLVANSGAEMSSLSGMFYPPYNVDVDFELDIDGVEGKLWVRVLYARKDYFPKDFAKGVDLSLYEQWDHTAPDGTPLLLALSSKGHGYIIAEREDAMLIYSIDGNFSRSAYPTVEEVMTKEELEMTAQVLNYAIQPEVLDRDAVWEKLEASNKAHEAENVYTPIVYGNFSEALKVRYSVPNELALYIFYDLTGDGENELLLSSNGSGAITDWYTIRDGQIQEDFGIDYFLCEGRVLEVYRPDPELDRGQHKYFHAYSDTEWTRNTSEERFGDWITTLSYADGVWEKQLDYHELEGVSISAEEAQSIMDQYPRIELDWKPVMDYPISETQSFREYLEEKDVRVSQEELHQIYKDYVKRQNEGRNMPYSHYRILDINGDGVDDLLLKGEDDPFIGNTDYYRLALTYRYGQIEGFAGDFYLCENNILEKIDTRHTGGIGVEINGHQFVRCHDLDEEILDFAAYNKSTGNWQVDWWTENSMTDEEANAILAKYPRIDQGMRPIEELLG